MNTEGDQEGDQLRVEAQTAELTVIEIQLPEEQSVATGGSDPSTEKAPPLRRDPFRPVTDPGEPSIVEMGGGDQQ